MSTIQQRAAPSQRAQPSDGKFWSFSLLSSLFGTLAIVGLARHSIATGSFVAPLQLVLDAYMAGKQVLFGWAEPYLESLLTWLAGPFNWHITLYPHWKDLFVLSIVLAGGHSRPLWRMNRLVAIYFFGFGVAGGLVAAAAVGTLSVQSSNLAAQLLIATLPLVMTWMGLAVAQLIAIAVAAVRKSHNFENLPLALSAVLFIPAFLAFVGALTTVFIYLFGGHDVAPFCGLAGLCLSLIIFGLFLFVIPYLSGLAGVDVDKESLGVRVTQGTGLGILGGFFGATLFFAIDAGVKLLH